MYLSNLRFFKQKLAIESMNLNDQLNLLMANLQSHTMRRLLLAYLQQELKRKKLAASSTRRMLMKLKHVKKKRQAKRKTELHLQLKQHLAPKIAPKKIEEPKICLPSLKMG